MEIKNSVVVVTGASSGIGAATARALAMSGARAVLLARRQALIDALANELGNDALAIACDVSQPEQVKAAVDTAMKRYGRMDALVNNAGQGLYAAIEDIGVSSFRELLDLNLVAPLIVMQAVIPVMRGQGSGCIINVSSGATLATYPGSAAYTSSKAGLNMLSSVARLELADAGIVVSTLHPFLTSTAFYGAVKSGVHAARAQETETTALAHPPERVAEMILVLMKSGAAVADLVPEAYGGTFKG
jgi:NADP-dependent 3-hydroxy acid dehydrogenase YdfG